MFSRFIYWRLFQKKSVSIDAATYCTIYERERVKKFMTYNQLIKQRNN